MINRLVLGLLIVMLFGAGGVLWYFEATKPVLPQAEASEIFVIRRGESIRNVASRLRQEDLIRSPVAFFLHVRLNGIGEEVQAGDFRLSPAMSTQEIASEFTHGTLDIWVTVPEGWRNGQIAAELSRELNIDQAEFLSLAKEGYMFPDTYLFPKEASAPAVANTFLSTFDRKVAEDLANGIEVSEFTLEEIVTLASIVEREAKLSEDRPRVASVLENRLTAGMPLQTDATLQYIKGYDEETGSWWPPVVPVDKELNSPYNTYQNTGLPPGPIANPGLASIRAVLSPADTNYLYYLSEPDGTTHYSRTLQQHNENIEKYLRK